MPPPSCLSSNLSPPKISPTALKWALLEYSGIFLLSTYHSQCVNMCVHKTVQSLYYHLFPPLWCKPHEARLFYFSPSPLHQAPCLHHTGTRYISIKCIHEGILKNGIEVCNYSTFTDFQGQNNHRHQQKPHSLSNFFSTSYKEHHIKCFFQKFNTKCLMELCPAWQVNMV